MALGRRISNSIQKPLVFGLLLFVLSLLRLLLSAGLLICFMPGSGYDDMLQILKSMSIADGFWLGEYGSLTLVKGAGYPMLTALFSKLMLPYIPAWHLLYILACLVFLHAAGPLATRRWQLLVCYCITVFNPIAFATQLTRLYRDIGYYSVSFLCVAMGFGLLTHCKDRFALVYAAGAGLTLGLGILYREDCQWLVIYIICCTVAAIVFRLLAFRANNGGQKLLSAFLLPIVSALCAGSLLLPVALLNQRHYGTFVLDEYNSGSYAAAYGALSRFDGGRQDPGVTIAEDMREYLYTKSPTFAQLRPVLDSEDAVLALWKETMGEYRTGYFSFVLRQAAEQIGIYESSSTANAFFRQLANEVNAIADLGEVPTGPKRSGVVARFYPWMAGPVAKATFGGLWATLRCEGITPLPSPVEADDAYLRHFENFVHGDIAAYRYMNSTGEIVEDFHLSGFQLWMQRACRVLVAAWRVALAPIFLVALAGFLVLLVALHVKGQSNTALWLHAVAVFSLLAALLLRSTMLGFVHVSAFPAIYTPSYQAATYPLVTGFAAAAFLFCCRWAPRIVKQKQ